MPVRERAWLLFGCEDLTTKTKNSPKDDSKIQKRRVFEWCSWSTDLHLLSDRAEESRALNPDHVINPYGVVTVEDRRQIVVTSLLYDFECGKVFGGRWVGLFQKVLIYWNLPRQPSLGFTETGSKWASAAEDHTGYHSGKLKLQKISLSLSFC